jgi:hypothetical protein
MTAGGRGTPEGREPPEMHDQRTPRPPRTDSDPKAPPRGKLAPEVVAAARLISPDVWAMPYRPGEGPMHMAGGPYWHIKLLALADKWERMAAAARACAEVLPDGG